LIKFADRLHNLWTLNSLPPKKRLRIAQETLKIYAPIAGLLGMWRLRWQLEDECFRYIDPENYNKIKKYYEIEQKYEREQYIEKIRQIVLAEAKKQKINCEINGRFKHIYSIFRKMQEKGKQFNEIYDVFALRVIVETIPDCYKMLGIIHGLWRPQKDRFKDYIAVPKPNGYRSLHTSVFGPGGKLTEFQIRTQEMNEEALYGIAAYWCYKEKGPAKFKTKSEWIDDLLELQKQYKNADDYIKNFQFDILDDRIFVFTPKGDVIDLPKDATPVDFAYHVHTEIGNKCVGALVNDKMAPLETKLKSGDIIQIVTEKNRPGPNLDWLKFVKTSMARSKIKQAAKSQGLLTTLLRKIRR
jgi:GTP pyrophosphokinase